MKNQLFLPDGKYRLFIYEIAGKEERWAYASYFKENQHIGGLEIPLRFFRQYFKRRKENWFFDRFFDLTLLDNGRKISLEKVNFGELSDLQRTERASCHMSRRHRRDLHRTKFMAQLLAEEYGSVDGFMDQENLTFEPRSVQEEIYRKLKQGQIHYLTELEGKLRG